ncbi:MAG: sugar nucleotide-binding protein [Lachnospiraceae bacterium]|nr:sugar nucleotide-binding protein [Lachnospiraceae bacterium]
MKALVGYTGFVGSNIYAAGEFDAAYNSKNIEEAYNTRPELLIYAGMRAEKYLANNEPEKDVELIVQAERNISCINPEKLVLISTVDVFKKPKDVDETTIVDTENLHPYGYHRYLLEQWVRENYPDALIIRLPGLFGKNIKKNFIYDYINVIPFMLSVEKMDELLAIDYGIKEYYQLQDNGFFKLRNISVVDKKELKRKFEQIGFSALNFTDSRSRYQFYNLSRLWGDIQTAVKADIRLWHPATEPISAGELYRYMTGRMFENELNGTPADYDYKTIHGDTFGGKEGYICDKSTILSDIRNFILKEIRAGE